MGYINKKMMKRGTDIKVSTVLGLILTSVLGRNSAVNKIIIVEIKVWVIRIADSLLIKCLIAGSSNLAIESPYITRAMLLPTSIVAINCEGFARNIDIILDENSPCFRFNSRRNLLDARKAISMPEKKAENINVMIIITR
jgi:hypothetical protein